jgi:hypothetical protein
MAEGSIHKICTCRDPDVKKLGKRCPQLRRTGGTWNPHHGKWAYQLELPKRADGSRRSLRRHTFDSKDAAAADRGQAIALLALAGDDTALATEIADLLQQVKAGAPMPDRDTIAKRVNAGLPNYLSTIMASGSDTERKAAIETLIAEVQLTDQGVVPVFKIPTDTTMPPPDPDGGTSEESPVRTMVRSVGRRGLEPRTYGLKVHSSAIELAARGCQGTCSGCRKREPPGWHRCSRR